MWYLLHFVDQVGSHPSERYLDILTEDLEKAFFMGDRDIRNDPKTYDEAMLNVDFEKWIEAISQKLTPCIPTKLGS